jgi:response regulator of citrate/malate metabolism
MRKMGYHGTIIGVSGGDDETMRNFMQAGADSVMQKPAKTDHLVNMLMEGFRKHVQTISDGDHSDVDEVGALHTSPKNFSSPKTNSTPTISTVISTMAHMARLRKFIADTDAAAATVAAAATAAATAEAVANTGGGSGASK